MELSLALIQPLKDLSSKIQDQSNEKHELSTLAELLAGILASGAPFEAKTENQSIWETQYKPIFHHALSKCSLELGTGPFAVTIKSTKILFFKICEICFLDISLIFFWTQNQSKITLL